MLNNRNIYLNQWRFSNLGKYLGCLVLIINSCFVSCNRWVYSRVMSVVSWLRESVVVGRELKGSPRMSALKRLVNFVFVLDLLLPRCMKCGRGLAMRKLSVRLSVCLSVCPSVKHVHCDKTEEKSVRTFTPYERSFSLVFWEEEWLIRGDPFYLKFWVNRPPLERNRRFSISFRS